MRIKETIAELISKYGTNDPFCIAERRNILILYELLGNILGYHNSSKRTQMIHLNTRLGGHMRKFVCAHELGHAVLHPKENTPFLRNNTLFSVDKIEREANEFAVELLVPDEELYTSTVTISCMTVREVSQAYGVPYELMRLKKLNT